MKILQLNYQFNHETMMEAAKEKYDKVILTGKAAQMFLKETPFDVEGYMVMKDRVETITATPVKKHGKSKQCLGEELGWRYHYEYRKG